MKISGTRAKPRVKDSGLPQELIKYTKYKWEFLRRNSEYLRDYKKLQTELERLDWGPPNGGPTKEEIKFMVKWKMNVKNPYVSYDEIINGFSQDLKTLPLNDINVSVSPYTLHKLSGKPFDAHRFMHDELNFEFVRERPIGTLDCWEWDHDGASFHRYIKDSVAETGKITITIDLNYSKNRLSKDFDHFLDEWNFLYKKANKKLAFWNFCKQRSIHSFPVSKEVRTEFEKIYKKKQSEKRQRYARKYHFENFDLYLLVYDLKKKRRSWKEITKALKLNSVQTARNHYQAACRLVKEGIDAYVTNQSIK